MVEPTKNIKGVSVILCCYNSSERLPNTLKHIANQKTCAEINWELIIVDNNSNDNTATIAKEEWNKLNLIVPLKVVYEGVPGLMRARETGIKVANYEYLLFCDDDNWLSSNYIDRIYEIFNHRSDVGAIGGQGMAVTEDRAELPEWFETVKNSYAVGEQANNTGVLTDRKYLWGAAMAIRRSIFAQIDKLKISSLLIGRKGDQLSSGEDAEISAWVLMCGYQLYYDETIIFQHFIPQKRLDINYYHRMLDGHNESFKIIKLYWHILDTDLDKINFRLKLKRRFYLIKKVLVYIKLQRQLPEDIALDFQLYFVPKLLNSKMFKILQYKRKLNKTLSFNLEH